MGSSMSCDKDRHMAYNAEANTVHLLGGVAKRTVDDDLTNLWPYN